MKNKKLPRVEFEGPMGIFYGLEEVPIEAFRKGIRELQQELAKRTSIRRLDSRHND